MCWRRLHLLVSMNHIVTLSADVIHEEMTTNEACESETCVTEDKELGGEEKLTFEITDSWQWKCRCFKNAGWLCSIWKEKKIEATSFEYGHLTGIYLSKTIGFAEYQKETYESNRRVIKNYIFYGRRIYKILWADAFLISYFVRTWTFTRMKELA